jgi:hypothetical protein
MINVKRDHRHCASCTAGPCSTVARSLRFRSSARRRLGARCGLPGPGWSHGAPGADRETERRSGTTRNKETPDVYDTTVPRACSALPPLRTGFVDAPKKKDRKFNGSLQQVLLLRTGRPVVGWSERGWAEGFRADPGRVSGGCRGFWVTDRRGPGARTRVRRCRSSHLDRQEASEWEGAYPLTR